MRYGETGVNLEVDLSRGSIEKEETDPRLVENFLGGKGSNIKVLWDGVPPEVEPFSPDNLLIFGPGLLVGTPVPGANRTCVSTISPQAHVHIYAAMGGFFGAELKHAGYDKVIIRGKSPTPVYLWINDDKVEIRDASHLWGQPTVETEGLIREELKQPRVQVACIGPAGENRVYMATVESAGSSASIGQGVVMGDKKLKAIAVRGTRDLNIARPAELIKLCEWALGKGQEKKPWDHIKYRRRARSRVEHTPLFYFAGSMRSQRERGAGGQVEVRGTERFGEDYWKKDLAFYESVATREMACYNCPVACRAVISVPEYSSPVFIKCGPLVRGLFGPGLDRDFAFKFHKVVAEGYGVDLGRVIEFAFKLREAGILTEEDFKGCPSDTAGTHFWLADKICHREGIGDVLANGCYLAAQQIGKGAEEYVGYTRVGIDTGVIPVKMFNPTYFLLFGAGDKPRILQQEIWFPQRTAEFANREEREAYIKEGYWDLPERFQKWFLEWESRRMRRTDPEAIVEAIDIAAYSMDLHHITDSVGLCSFWTGFETHPPFPMKRMAELVSYVTGMDVDEAELIRKARRIDTLHRAYHVRRGYTRKDDFVPDDYYPVKEPGIYDKTLDEYYKFKGWNLAGVPTKETLEELGLDYVGEELERRELL